MSLKQISFGTFCIALFLSFLILMFSAASNISLITSNQQSVALPDIIIDAGHGGEDGGAVSDNGIIEKDINLAISKDTSDILTFFGFNVIMTRKDDNALSDNEDTVHERKVSDLNKRLEIFNSSENNIIISIHQNKFEQPQYYGTQIFYSPNNDNSLNLAESIKGTVTSLLQPNNERECKPSDSGIFLLKNTQNPAVLVECGFLSNPDECSKLITEEYQKNMAFAVANGFINYFNTNRM